MCGIAIEVVEIRRPAGRGILGGATNDTQPEGLAWVPQYVPQFGGAREWRRKGVVAQGSGAARELGSQGSV